MLAKLWNDFAYFLQRSLRSFSLIIRIDEIATSILCTACHRTLHEVHLKSSCSAPGGRKPDLKVRKPSTSCPVTHRPARQPPPRGREGLVKRQGARPQTTAATARPRPQSAHAAMLETMECARDHGVCTRLSVVAVAGGQACATAARRGGRREREARSEMKERKRER